MMICFENEEWEKIQTEMYILNGLIDQLFVKSWQTKEHSVMECASTLTSITEDIINIQKQIKKVKDLTN